MDLKAFGHDSAGNSGGIAAGCPGTVSDGSCYFDEFLKHIQHVGKNSRRWTGKTSVGSWTDPDVFDTARELSGSTYKNTPDASKLFPNLFGSHDPMPGFGKVYDAVTDRIQACRQRVGDGALRLELDAVREAMFVIHDVRVADQAKTCIAGINAELTARGVSWVSTFLSPSATKNTILAIRAFNRLLFLGGRDKASSIAERRLVRHCRHQSHSQETLKRASSLVG